MIKIILPETSDTIFRNNTLPTLSYVSESSNQPEWFYAMHRHKNLCEIVFIKEGKGDFIVNNVPYEVSKGDILIYNKGILHQESSNPEYPLKAVVYGIQNIFLKDIEDNCILPHNISPVIKANTHNHTEKIEKYIFDIFEECSTQSQGFEFICQNILASLIMIITRIISEKVNIVEQDSDIKSLTYQMKQFMNENYMCDIKLKDIANKFYISPWYLAHMLKRELGFSPIRYIINRRIGEAQKYLLSTDMSISKISCLVGYENVNYFNNLFKKTVGLSPGKFRDLYKPDLASSDE